MDNPGRDRPSYVYLSGTKDGPALWRAPIELRMYYIIGKVPT